MSAHKKNKKIIFLLLLIGGISTLVMAGGNRRGGINDGRGLKSLSTKNHLADMFSGLSHGALSDTEATDLQKANQIATDLQSIQFSLGSKRLEDLKTENPNKATQIDEKIAQLQDRMSNGPAVDPIISYIADSYNFTLEETTIDTAPYDNMTTNTLLDTSANKQIEIINFLQTAYDNAESEDLKLTHLLLQKRASNALRATSQMMLSNGISPSQQVISMLNKKNIKIASNNSSNYPEGLSENFKAGQFNRRGKNFDYRNRSNERNNSKKR